MRRPYQELKVGGCTYLYAIALVFSQQSIEMSASAATSAILAANAAAAARRQRMRLLLAEEEEMTRYTPEDLDDDWEFKIVRASPHAFREPEVLSQLLAEEARAGWVMLEKFDDSRIRFKRQRSARAQDANLATGIDPYRTYYGYGALSQVRTVAATSLFAIGILLLLGALSLVLFVLCDMIVV